ncbi:MAG: hypothetical protein P8N23_05080 [Methylophilaceae bacterium]|nr:hypothetical protein [Methylophilaceae bacterium]
MTLKIFIHKPSALGFQEKKALKVLADGFLSRGYVVTHNFFDVPSSSFSVIFGSVKLRFNFNHLVKKIITLTSKNFLVLESPVVGRASQHIEHMDDAFRVGINGFFADNGFSYAKDNCNSEINKNIFIKYNSVTDHILFKDNKIIGIALQVPGDASLKGFNQTKWIEDFFSGKVVNKSFLNGNRFIVRAPPLMKGFSAYKLNNLSYNNVIFQVGTNANKDSFFDDIDFLITFSSTMAVDSILRGVPSCATDSRSFLNLVTSSSLLDCFNKEFYIDEHYLNVLSNTTWRISQLDSDHFHNMVVENLVS